MILAVIIAPAEEFPVQDTDFAQPNLDGTFEMGHRKARTVLADFGATGGKFSTLAA